MNTNASSQPATLGSHSALPRANWPAAATGSSTVSSSTAPSRKSISRYCTAEDRNSSPAQNTTASGFIPGICSRDRNRAPTSPVGTAASRPLARDWLQACRAATSGMEPAATIPKTSSPRTASRSQAWPPLATPQVMTASSARTATGNATQEVTNVCAVRRAAVFTLVSPVVVHHPNNRVIISPVAWRTESASPPQTLASTSTMQPCGVMHSPIRGR